MQGDSPEADPRLQKSNPGPSVATGHVDPCILYLEATEKGEVPVLFACWARSSSEVREAGGMTRLKLGKVVILVGKPQKSALGWSMQDGKTLWNFNTGTSKELEIRKDASGWRLKGFPNSCFSQNSQAYGYQGSLKYLDQENDQLLLKFHAGHSVASPLFIQRVLELATVEWPSLVNARASLPIKSNQLKSLQREQQQLLYKRQLLQSRANREKRRESQRPNRISLLRKIIAAVFK